LILLGQLLLFDIRFGEKKNVCTKPYRRNNPVGIYVQ